MRPIASALATVLAVAALPAAAATITFDDLITGQTSYGFDGDGDGIDDVIFSTTDPAGFNTIGPGLNQDYISEPGLEGSATLNPDLRVDFVFGATQSLEFGFAVSNTLPAPNALTFSVFDADDNLLASDVFDGIYDGDSTFAENLASINFAGTAAYATFDFASFGVGRYIIDNFTGTFGSTETAVPEPASWAMMIAGFGLVGGAMRSRRREAVRVA